MTVSIQRFGDNSSSSIFKVLTNHQGSYSSGIQRTPNGSTIHTIGVTPHHPGGNEPIKEFLVSVQKMGPHATGPLKAEFRVNPDSTVHEMKLHGNTSEAAGRALLASSIQALQEDRWEPIGRVRK